MQGILFLHPRNWSRYSRRYSGDKDGLRHYKRVILLSQFTLFGAIVGVLHALEDLVDGLLFMPMMDGIMALSIFVCYLLNENGKHKAARITLLSFLNVFFLVYSSLAHPDLGIYLYFFSWVGLAAVVFELNENFWRFFFISISIAFTMLLFATDFQLFGSHSFPAVDIERSFIINFVSSISVLVFFIVFMVNMNEQSERKLMGLASEVQQKNVDLEKVNRELDRFFYSASHDLKVPLLDIKGAINSAIAEFNDEEVLAYFEVLKNRADKMDQFLQDIIDYSRNSETAVRNEVIQVSQLFDQVIDNFTFTKGADKIEFIKDIHVQVPVECDRVRLIIIMNNILSNAIKYHRLGETGLWIKLHASIVEQKLIISIADNGTGIEEELLPKIFNMFFRGTNQSKGSGLGLYIVKEAIEKLGGQISVQSQKGLGSIFTMIVPINVGIAPASTTVIPKEKSSAQSKSVS